MTQRDAADTAVNTTLRIAFLHLAPTVGDVAANRQLVTRAVMRAAGCGAAWVLTPELCISGYQFADAIGTAWIAPQPDTWMTDFCSLVARLGVTVFLSHPERDAATDTLYNTLFVIGPDGAILGKHHKISVIPGTGCLLVRRRAAQKLRRPWFSGGTLTFTSVVADGHYLTPGPASFEDGTTNYLSIPAVERGLQLIESVGIDTIHTRVTCLTGWLIDQLVAMRHSNGQPVVQLYGPATIDRRGGIVQVNFFDPDGCMHDCYTLEQLANSSAFRCGPDATATLARARSR